MNNSFFTFENSLEDGKRKDDIESEVKCGMWKMGDFC